MKTTECDCPNCGEQVEDLGTLTLICWNCGIQFVPHDSQGNLPDEDDYYRYDS